MKTSLKKLVAGASIFALVAMNALSVNGAAVNDVNVSDTNWVITLNSATDFSWTIKVVVNGNTRTASVNAGNIEITDADGTSNTTLDAGNYSISFVSDQGTSTDSSDDLYWAVVYNTLTAWANGSNKVTVTASVLPVLSLTIANSVIDLWNLTSTAIKDSDTDTVLTVATNAADWYVVSASASNFAFWAYTIPFVSRSAQLAWTSGFSIDVASVSQWTAGTSTVASTSWEATASTFVVANSSASFAGASASIPTSTKWTTNGDVINVNYAGSVSAVQEAGTYSTTVTYTVTGNF